MSLRGICLGKIKSPRKSNVRRNQKRDKSQLVKCSREKISGETDRKKCPWKMKSQRKSNSRGNQSRKKKSPGKISRGNQASEKIKSQSGIISQVKSNVWMKKCFPGHLIAS